MFSLSKVLLIEVYLKETQLHKPEITAKINL